jgi:thiamine monophosphate synthase
MWELCRARGLAPAYIACGPVWPTTTKDMPWRPQGLDNLAWWCRTAQAPVVAIGGILEPGRVRQAAASGASGVCVLRGLGSDPRLTVAALQQAFEEGHREALARLDQAVAPPHPTLGPLT